ncbi:hypothetical protein EHO60_16315 [Leptospira fletcheri]|uniref:Uncharacterized protein n=1 Tax=Leptospira fletcheri TaxID=2484981 RepID=A0A4R9G3U3_9LEPT|nr:hypothetical protein [Leptospira fletcheri]TGK06158.1 hypothetical protein EHO60_16315 [Leptospira fletcheri]
MERELRGSKHPSSREDSCDPGEISKILFHSLLSFLSKKEGPVSKTEIKSLLVESLNLVSGFRAEWAEIRKFGKGKLLVAYRNKVLVLDAEETVNTILRLWDDTLESRK